MLPIKTNQPGVGPQGAERSWEQMGNIMFNKELEDQVVQNKLRERDNFISGEPLWHVLDPKTD